MTPFFRKRSLIYILVAAAGLTFTGLAAAPPIFADGFETGDTSEATIVRPVVP